LCLLTDINCHRQRFTPSLCVRVIFVCVKNSVFSLQYTLFLSFDVLWLLFAEKNSNTLLAKTCYNF